MQSLHTSQTNSETQKTGLNEKDCAAFFGVSLEVVRKWRQHKTGPRFKRVGRSIRYSLDDLRAYWDSLPCGGEHEGAEAKG
jgi:hypothetical protein